MPVFFLIAGEASGDILGARLMRALRAKLKGDVKFVGIGGPHMIGEGLELFFPHTELMHFGVIEVIRHVPRLLNLINRTAQEVIRVHPEALITIDSPDFCFRVAKKVRTGCGVRGAGKEESSRNPHPASRPLLIHYVAPTVWAWRPGRAKKIARFLDHLLAVLPFEPPYFTREGLGCTFVGHSIVEGNAANGDAAAFRANHKIAPDTPLLTVLFGSRTSEMNHLAPIFRKTVQKLHPKHPDMQLVIPTVAHLKNRVMREVETWGIKSYVVESDKDKYDGFAASRAALACSGTVALELALAHLPAVIAYEVNTLTAALYRRFIRTPYVNLVNIMHGEMLVPEFIQENCKPDKLAAAVDILLSDETARRKQIEGLAMTAGWLGYGQFIPSERAAEAVLDSLSRNAGEGGAALAATGEGGVDAGIPIAVPRPTIPSPVSRKMREPPSPALRERGYRAVLQILPALVTGGVERGTVEMVSALTKNGFRAFVASSGGPMAREVEAAGGTHIALPLASKNPFTIYANISRLAKIIREQKIDIIHVRSRAPAWSAWFAAKKTQTPFVTTFHNAYGAKSSLKRFYNSAMAKGDRIIAISDFVAGYAENIYGVTRERLRVIHRGVDSEKFNRDNIDTKSIDALRQAWGIQPQNKVILMPGRITRWKGQSVLIKALAKMQRRDFTCVIVGGGKDGSYGQELAQEIRKAGLEKNIALYDICRDMPAAYALADIVAVPSTRPEGFGRVVTEAQAMGAIVIAANHGGATETVIDGETGFLTRPGDADELAAAINKVFSMSADERHNIATRAVAHIRANFTTDSMTSKTLAVYRELL